MKHLAKNSATGITTIFLLLIIFTQGCGNGDADADLHVETQPMTYQETGLKTTQLPATGTISTETRSQAERRNIPEEMLDAYSQENQLKHLYTLSSDSFQGRMIGSAGGAGAADYIEAEFTRLGLKPWSAAGLGAIRQPFTAEGFTGANLVGELPGGTDAGQYIILAAHFDHLGVDASGNAFNGADDNAAGVAAVLEAARIFANLGVAPSRNMVFCAFDGEEQGELGAEALGNIIVGAGIAEDVEMINIDGIGATGGSYFGVWDEGAIAAAPLVQALAEAGSLLGVVVKNDGTDIGSDAQPFNWQFGIPAVTVDWNWGYDPSLYHPYYHTINDDPDFINRDVMAAATRVALTGFWLRASQAD